MESPPRRHRRRWWFLAIFGAALAALVAKAWPRRVLIRRAVHLAWVWTPVAVWHSHERIVAALDESGPVFIKLAQWLSTRRDILSPDLCDEMGKLHETVKCGASPGDRRRAEELVDGLKVGELLGGGCIAQVYLGVLDGQTVAVKVRRERVHKLLESDIVFLRLAANLAEWYEPELKWLAMHFALDNFGKYLIQQVNFSIEAEHNNRFRYNFQGTGVSVPAVMAATESVMVTEVADGVSLSDFIHQHHADEARKAVFEQLTDVMSRMVLKDRFIHGDLHPGNIFVSLSPRRHGLLKNRDEIRPSLTLIDTGIAIELSGNVTMMAKKAMIACIKKQPLALGEAVVQLHRDEGLTDSGEDIEKLIPELGYLMYSGAFMATEEIWSKEFATFEDYNGTRVSEYFWRMMSYLSQHKVVVSPSLWSLMTAFALIEGSVTELGYGINVLQAAMPYIYSRFNVLEMIKSKMRFEESRRHRLQRE